MTRTIRCAYSIHDVMPETLGRVESLFHLILSYGHNPITLLVVPGCEWSMNDIKRLEKMIEQGGVVAGHGWSHRARHIRGLYHRLHSRFISRHVAEHLALNRDEAMQLVRDCYDWFAMHDLPTPTLYVPPAWAIGPLKTRELEQLPFRQYELMNTVYDRLDHNWHQSPMLGLEAREAWRVPFIRLWNWYNYRRASRSGVLRIGIHPDDDRLPMSKDLHHFLQQDLLAINYCQLCE